MTNMFFDVLGILLAFLTVIALLSLIVTGLVQMIQSTFGIRGKNVHFMVRKLLEYVGVGEKKAVQGAAKVLNETPAGLVSRGYDFDKWLSRLAGPPVSWIEPQELPRALREAKIGLSEAQLTKIEKGFDAVSRAMDKRLKRNMRAIAIVCSLVVAVAFQVSAPELFQRLSKDSVLRARYIELAEKDTASFDEASKALDELAVLGFEPWSDPDFYYSKRAVQWPNLFGVLITALLLTFGAPFWFDKLKQVASLRDALKTEKPDGG